MSAFTIAIDGWSTGLRHVSNDDEWRRAFSASAMQT
jgi:hypothetical protein